MSDINDPIIINSPSDIDNRVWVTSSIEVQGTIEIVVIKTIDGQENETISLVKIQCNPSDNKYIEVQMRIKPVELPIDNDGE